jgi:hypothetical protein
VAKIPDKAVMSMSEVPPAAFNLFAYYCMRRNKETGTCFPSQKKTATETGINYAYVSTLKTILVKKGWIEITDEGHIRPLKGFENSKDSLEIPKSEASKPEAATLEIPKTVSKIPNSTLEIPKSEFENSKVPSILSEPAQLTSPTNQGEARTRAPDPAPDLTCYVPVIERLTGTKAGASWQMSERITQQAMALRELGFSPGDVERTAKSVGKSNYRLGFIAEDLAADRNRQTNGKAHTNQRPPETTETEFRTRKRI